MDPIATKVGNDILNNGGNAIDAAVAISTTLAVTKFPFFILLRFTDLTLPTKFTSSPSLIDPIVERDVLSKYFRGK